MADSSLGRAAFLSQADALLRKNLTYQKRNLKSLIRLFFFPILFFILLGWAQKKIGEFTKEISIPEIRDPPPAGPSMLQVPSPAFRAVKTGFLPYQDLPDPSCLKDGSCPASILFTGSNKSLSTSVADKLIPSPSPVDPADVYSLLVDHAWGSDGFPMEVDGMGYFSSGGFEPLYDTVYQVQPWKKVDTVSTQRAAELLQLDVRPVEALPLWRDSSSQISDELYKGYSKGNADGNISEIMIAYDLLTTNGNNFNVNVWYNSTFDSPIIAENKDMISATMNPALRVPRTVNLVTNAYIKLLLGDGAGIPFDYVKSMPMPASQASFDVLQIVGPVLFLYMILLLFPVMLTSLVYEKQEKLRIIMKMHGLTDGTYWTVTYAYNFVICFIYVVIFCNMGELFGFRMFTLNSYGMQYLFFFIYINLQIAMAFLLGSVFSNVKTASVVGYIIVFGSGLVTLIFTKLLDSPSFPSYLLTILELYPGLGLARGLYELLKSGDEAFYTSTVMSIKDMSDGMKEVLIIMVVEWFVFLFAAYYLDQALAAGGGVRKNPFSNIFKKKPQKPIRMSSIQRAGPNVAIQMEKDVAQERQKVEQLLSQPDPDYLIVCNDIKKMYPARDGNPPKYAVKGLSLALPRGECFGMLGPNGAGKSSFISMMIGLTEPSSGTAYIQGLDIRTDMDEVYTSMGVCPQHDLLWETLTGREHLLFYGRLKQLSGSALHQAVEESLDAVNLLGVADKQAGQYSGGMKRRLSVAISLIGDPKVVYMDEPSTGLDPASRNLLWNVVKNAKRNRAIILTTHSMEEAEYLCDRLGIFVSGSLQCVGTTSELKGRYGGSFILTVTTSPNHDGDIETLAHRLSPGAARVYHIPGTQKFELPKYDVKISDVFQAVDDAKKMFPIQAWGLADTTLEDVFIKVAREAQSVKSLS